MVNEQGVRNRAYEHYGHKHQMLKCVEEMSELTKELIKDLNGKLYNRCNILEEYADLMITLEYVKYAYKLTDDEITFYRQRKLERLERRMDDDDAMAIQGKESTQRNRDA